MEGDPGSHQLNEMPAALDDALSLFDFESLARNHISHGAWERVQGGAADELTVRWNHEAYEQIRLRPRVLVDVSKLDTRVNLFGQELPFPILLAPTGAQGFVHPDGDLATARGAGAAHATLVISGSASMRVEDIAKAATGPVWFQLYVQRDRGFTRDLVQRAEGAGCRALCVSVDSPTHGVRNREQRSRAELPERPLPNLQGKDYLDPTVTWKDIEWLQSFAKTPVLLKGILNPDDAAIAVKAGVSGIMVSNHGGRNLDTVPATIERIAAGRGQSSRPDSGDCRWWHPARYGCFEGAGAGRDGGGDRAPLSLWPGHSRRGRRHASGGDSAQGIRIGDDAHRTADHREH